MSMLFEAQVSIRTKSLFIAVHDAVACLAPEKEAEEARVYVEECMRTVPDWAVGLPINCESGVGVRYGDC